MYSVIRRYNIIAGSARKIAQRVNAELVPLLSRQRGFVSYHLCDPSDGTLVAVSVYDNREGAEASTHVATEWVRTHIAPMIKTAPVIITGEVVAAATHGTVTPVKGAAPEPVVGAAR